MKSRSGQHNKTLLVTIRPAKSWETSRGSFLEKFCTAVTVIWSKAWTTLYECNLSQCYIICMLFDDYVGMHICVRLHSHRHEYELGTVWVSVYDFWQTCLRVF